MRYLPSNRTNSDQSSIHVDKMSWISHKLLHIFVYIKHVLHANHLMCKIFFWEYIYVLCYLNIWFFFSSYFHENAAIPQPGTQLRNLVSGDKKRRLFSILSSRTPSQKVMKNGSEKWKTKETENCLNCWAQRVVMSSMNSSWSHWCIPEAITSVSTTSSLMTWLWIIEHSQQIYRWYLDEKSA